MTIMGFTNIKYYSDKIVVAIYLESASLAKLQKHFLYGGESIDFLKYQKAFTFIVEVLIKFLLIYKLFRAENPYLLTLFKLIENRENSVMTTGSKMKTWFCYFYLH